MRNQTPTDGSDCRRRCQVDGLHNSYTGEMDLDSADCSIPPSMRNCNVVACDPTVISPMQFKGTLQVAN